MAGALHCFPRWGTSINPRGRMGKNPTQVQMGDPATFYSLQSWVSPKWISRFLLSTENAQEFTACSHCNVIARPHSRVRYKWCMYWLSTVLNDLEYTPFYETDQPELHVTDNSLHTSLLQPPGGSQEQCSALHTYQLPVNGKKLRLREGDGFHFNSKFLFLPLSRETPVARTEFDV